VTLAPGFFWLDEQIAIDLPGARALFTTRRGGVSEGPFASLNLGLTAAGVPIDDPARVEVNRAHVLGLTGRAGVALGRQVHGADVARVDAPRSGYRVGSGAADGQATAREDVAVAVHVADCLPIALAGGGAVAMLHGGWRGLAGGVLQAGIATLRELGADAAIEAAIGPGVGGCCYEVGDEVRAQFAGYGADVVDGRRLDLKRVARRALDDAGVAAVADVGLCTICGDATLFFSHRRDHGVTGRQAGVAWRS
jgi:YfiH family protein